MSEDRYYRGKYIPEGFDKHILEVSRKLEEVPESHRSCPSIYAMCCDGQTPCSNCICGGGSGNKADLRDLLATQNIQTSYLDKVLGKYSGTALFAVNYNKDQWFLRLGDVWVSMFVGTEHIIIGEPRTHPDIYEVFTWADGRAKPLAALFAVVWGREPIESALTCVWRSSSIPDTTIVLTEDEVSQRLGYKVRVVSGGDV